MDEESKKILESVSCRPKIKCPECSKQIVDLPRHLKTTHKWDAQSAKLARMELGLRKSMKRNADPKRKRIHQKYRCPVEGCGKIVVRINDHLYKQKPHNLKDNPEEYRRMLALKEPVDESLLIKFPMQKQKKVIKKRKRVHKFMSAANWDCSSNTSDTDSKDLSAEYIPKCKKRGSEDIEDTDKPIESEEEPDLQKCLLIYREYLMSPSGSKKDYKSSSNVMNQIRRLIEVISPDHLDYMSIFDLCKLDQVWLPHTKSKGYEPGTVRSYLIAVGSFMDFIIRSKVTPYADNIVNLKNNHLDIERMRVVRDEVAKWRQALRGEEDDRKTELLIECFENTITKEDFQTVIRSPFNQAVIKNMKFLLQKHGNSATNFRVTREIFTNCRDSLFFSLIVNNISRSGACANMTVEEYLKGTNSMNDHFVVLVKRHKTSRIYGPCQIVLNKELKELCDIYFNIIRKAVPGNKQPSFFITWSGRSLESGGVSTQLHSFFKKCLPDDSTDRKKNVSATQIRKSLLTFFYDNLPHMKEDLGHLMKHNPKTGERNYYLNKMRREVAITSEKVNEAVFSSSIGEKEEVLSEPAEIAPLLPPHQETKKDSSDLHDSDEDFIPPSDDESDALVKKKVPWSKEEVEALVELFGDTTFEVWHQTLIRKLASECLVLKNRTSKQILDKLNHLKKSGHFNSDEKSEAEIKEAGDAMQSNKMYFSAHQTACIKDLFKKEISGRGVITQEGVKRKIDQHVISKDVLKGFTPAQLVAKVRYEKSRMVNKKY